MFTITLLRTALGASPDGEPLDESLEPDFEVTMVVFGEEEGDPVLDAAIELLRQNETEADVEDAA